MVNENDNLDAESPIERARRDVTLEINLVGHQNVRIVDPTTIMATRRGLMVTRQDGYTRREFYNWRIVNAFTLGNSLWPRFLEE